MTSASKQRYEDARVEGAKTVRDSYLHYETNPDSFIGGVQYALDLMMKGLERTTVDTNLVVEYAIALEILERAKRGEPQ